MAFKTQIQQNAMNVVIDKMVSYLEKDPEANFDKIVDGALFLGERVFPSKAINAIKEGAKDESNVWRQFAMEIIAQTDPEVLKKMIKAIGAGAALKGTKAVRENREKYKCNIPWLILLDPTSACNLKCKGCWSAEYGHLQQLTLDEMRDVVRQGKELGTHVYMFTGGEPLIKKDEVIQLCAENTDCVFLAYTNATLVDQAFCDEMKRVGNLSLAVSIEGNRETTDARRGEGTYDIVIKALDLLKENRLLYGISVCYTRENVEKVTSDEFLDLMIEKGVRFGFYFCYFPVGQGAVKELIPTTKQREHMYAWIKRMRNGKEGKPLFMFDFQDDGEYVGGCIAGGRNYFHINSAGDVEPCVFIHYSDTNIRTHTILEALRSPLFTAYYHNQPFNDNHLRPCPLMENPEILRRMVKETGAKSTDLVAPEDVDVLCDRCVEFASEWEDVSQELWKTRNHPNPKTQYWRDAPQGKAESVRSKMQANRELALKKVQNKK